MKGRNNWSGLLNGGREKEVEVYWKKKMSGVPVGQEDHSCSMAINETRFSCLLHLFTIECLCLQ